MGHQEHRQQASEVMTTPIRCGVITISDTRTPETDTSGAAIRNLLEAAGHTVQRYELVADNPARIGALVRVLAAECQVIITSGGTGIARFDRTFEAVDGLLQKRLPGFGELFRMLSYDDVGAAAMLSRAVAGLYEESVIFCLPGSTAAVRLALEKLIVPELAHLVWEILRQERQPEHSASTEKQPSPPSPHLSHLDTHGHAHMVAVGHKAETWREATARAVVRMQPETLRLVASGGVPKGDVLAVARVAGIAAAKRTPELVPLCHPLLLTHVAVALTPDEVSNTLQIEAVVRSLGQTGVEMEALTAASVAALTIYDMCKGVDRTMRLTDIELVQKRGGRSDAGGTIRDEG